MKKVFGVAVLAFGAAALVSTQGTVVQGTVKKVDAAAKTVSVATANGTEQVVHFTDKTVVHPTVAGAKDAFSGMKEGSEVVIHTTGSGAKTTAVEVDHLGKEGLKMTEGTVTKIGEGGKTIGVKTADGAEVVFDTTTSAASEAGTATAKGADKAGKVTVYYTEEGGKKVAHFFKKAM